MKSINYKIMLCLLSLIVSAGSHFLRTNSLAEEASQAPVPALDAGASQRLIDIDYRDVDIKEIARAFSEISGKNIIVSDEAKANVTLKMEKVDWETALEVILDTYNLAYIEKDNFIIITTAERRRLQEESGTLETKIIRLNFVKVSNIQGTLNSMLTSRGKINTDERTNSLIITDIKERISDIEEVALQLDTRTPQVLIETLVVDVKLGNAFQFGVVEAISNHIRSEYDDGEPIEKITKWTGNSATAFSDAGATFTWAKTVFKNLDLNWTLDSIKTNTQAEVLANPRITTLDNLPANIDIITNIPYTVVKEASGGGQLTGTEFVEVGITLSVTPHITADNYISLEVNTTYSVDTGADTTPPTIASRTASTNVLIKDGETMVMGGLRRRDASNSMTKVPILGDIPFLGNLFSKKNDSLSETELVIFITPHLVGDAPLSGAERVQLDSKNNIRDLTAETFSFKDKELLPMRPPVKIK